MGSILLAGGVIAAAAAAFPAPRLAPRPTSEPVLAPFSEPIREAATAIEMIPVPGSADGSIPGFHISKSEIPWEVFDVFVYRLDVGIEDEAAMWADTESRPSKPYLPPDRGFGHQGYAAISLTHHAATKFCQWLSERTGRTYRLPTEDEWERAARLRPDGTLAEGSYANDIGLEELGEIAWFKGNSGNRPHPIGTRRPSPLGLLDLHGNVAEWVNGRDGRPTTKGGSYRDTPRSLSIESSTDQTSAWNASDPQIPKSTWWLSDGPMVGFRIVCEPAAAAPETAPETTPDTPSASPSQESDR
jgi:formylglycine-generating enzyme required for sulfatase activity